GACAADTPNDPARTIAAAAATVVLFVMFMLPRSPILNGVPPDPMVVPMSVHRCACRLCREAGQRGGPQLSGGLGASLRDHRRGNAVVAPWVNGAGLPHVAHRR